MRTIKIANDKKRDAEVCMEAAVKPPRIRRTLEDGSDYFNIKVLKHNLELAFETLSRNYDNLVEMGQALIDGDPEIDMEVIGKKVGATQKLYLNKDSEIAYRVNLTEIIKDPSGVEKERRDRVPVASNVSGESVVQWTGRKFAKSEAVRKFVFQRKLQIKHINGLTYDFLHAMAKSLQDSDSLMMVGAGRKGAEPLILSQGGERYRGFLEGRVDGEKYCLILHLTNLEMKATA